MWLFNIRGSDIDFNPLAKSYAVVTETEAHLFIDASKIPPHESSSLEGVVLHPYDDIFTFLAEMARGGMKISVDSSQLSWKLCEVINLSSPAEPMAAVESPSCITMLKSIKNEVELKGIRDAHYRDGVALTAFLAWLEGAVKTGAKLSECDSAAKLEEFRQKMPCWVSPSFATISGYGSNGVYHNNFICLSYLWSELLQLLLSTTTRSPPPAPSWERIPSIFLTQVRSI